MKTVEIFRERGLLFGKLTRELNKQVENRLHTPFFLALSGGETAKEMFRYWVSAARDSIPWSRIRFFWVDERCVPPYSEESNYFQARKRLFVPLHIPASHLFRIKGEELPEVAAAEYEAVLREHLPRKNGRPVFDALILGAGTDGHTALIFPDNLALLSAASDCAVVRHPDSGQKRITLTGPVLWNARSIWLPVIGTEKRHMIERIVSARAEDLSLPVNAVYRGASCITLYAEVR